MRHLMAVLIVLVSGACSDASEPQSAPTTPGPTTTPTCRTSLPFVPEVVPAGLEPTPISGVGGGGESPPGSTAFHFRSATPGRFIDVFRGEGRYALSDASNSVSVLGGSGRIGEIHEGFGADFEVASEQAGCREFAVEAFGITREELRQFLEGLERAP
jgi:hypothetical protein